MCAPRTSYSQYDSGPWSPGLGPGRAKPSAALPPSWGLRIKVRLSHSLPAGQTTWRSNDSHANEDKAENQLRAEHASPRRGASGSCEQSASESSAQPPFQAGMPSTHLASNIPLLPKGPNPLLDS